MAPNIITSSTDATVAGELLSRIMYMQFSAHQKVAIDTAPAVTEQKLSPQ